ncbi:MAG TPA: amidohydrolase [Pyrinomonadaceae bacterium]|jgi:predicted amidohydrolase YtcJ|nr:amidohydrolase [Pyrinomonadaceae bacterium]
MIKNIFAISLALFLLGSVGFGQKLSADLIIVNANIQTMDPIVPKAQAIAVMGNRIVAVGTNAEINALADARTKVIDAGGKLVMPGFNDAHLHFTEGGFQLSLVDLRSAASPEEFAARIKAFAAKLQKGQWILGGRWDHENWKPNNLPTKELIDAVTPDNPVFVQRLDGHMAVANSLALKLAGVNKDTKDVDGGLIVRDAAGNPTGVLKDAAMEYVRRVVPDFSFDQKLAAAEAATNYAASLGVTSAQDMSANTNIGVYQELLRQGKLKTRIYAGAPLPDWQKLADTGIRYAFGDPMLRVGTLKGYADGSLGSTTAWFFDPYADSPNTSGLSGAEIPQMYEHVSGADKAGLQVMIHAIGDRGNATILDVFERVAREDGARDRRFRIEHAQHLRQQDIPRFGRLGVVASMQPVHLADDGRWAGKRLDEKRLKGTYAFRTLLDTGAHLAFGTDWAVAPLNPFFGILAAVTRQTTDGKNPNGWIPEQKITIEEAVRAYTQGSAYAEFQENIKGTLSAGKLADIIIVSDDIFTGPPLKMMQTKVLTTIVDGKIVYEAK